MNLQRWCFSFLILVSLSCGSDGSDCKSHHETYHGTEINSYEKIKIDCKPRHNSPIISIEFVFDRFLEIKCNRALNWSNFEYERTPESQTHRDFDFDSCQLLESKQIDFIKQNLPLENIDSLTLISLNLDVALNLSRSILKDFKNITELRLDANNFTDISSHYLQEFSDLQYLYLTSNVLGKLSDDFLISPSLKFFYLQANGLKVINSTTFNGIRNNIHSLYVHEKNLHRIESDSFTYLLSLKYIEINCERLQSLPANIFTGLRSLQTLDLSGNNFTYELLSPDLLRKNTELRSFSLSYNAKNLKTLPNKFLANMTNLEMIKIIGNGLVTLPEDLFFGSIKLRDLHMKNNDIKSFPPQLFKDCKQLYSINFQYNQIHTLPDGVFSNQANLNSLDLSNNQIDVLPNGIFSNQTNLRFLDLSNNQVGVLQNGIFSTQTKLKSLNLSNNQIKILPNGIFSDQTNLISLDLSNNRIYFLPNGSFTNLTKLEWFDLSNNQINVLPNGIFSNQKNLSLLNLSDNRIITISRSVFGGLENLQNLNMTRNNLQIIEDNRWDLRANTIILSHNNLTLDNLPESFVFYCTNLELSYNHIYSSQAIDYLLGTSNLRNLNLQHNRLENITNKNWKFLSYNMEIDLRYNGIKKITMRTDVKKMKPLGFGIVNVGNNPIDCDCEVYDFLNYLEKESYPSMENSFRLNVSSLECQYPSWLKNKSVASLKSETFKCLTREPETINVTCPDKCKCWRRPRNKLYIIDCSNIGLQQAPDDIKGPAGYQIELNLTNNSLTSMPSLLGPGYDKVTVLLLSHNKIGNIPLQSLSKNLRELYLHNNKLSRIDTPIFNYLKNSMNLTNLTLHDNLWECSCKQNEFLKFIQATRSKLVDLNKLSCGEMKQKFYLIASEDLCPNHLLIVSCIGIAIFGIIIAMYYRYQKEIKIWLYARQWCLWLVSEDELDRDKIYDAFISYSHQDDDFVVNELVAKLEEGPKPFKLCIHFRDWLPGEWIPNQVARSVENSKRTVIVLSANFIHSDWGRMEFHAAHSQALNDGRTRVIVIIYGEIPPLDDLDSELRAYLTMNTYLKWDDPWFWKKLRFALPHRI